MSSSTTSISTTANPQDTQTLPRVPPTSDGEVYLTAMRTQNLDRPLHAVLLYGRFDRSNNGFDGDYDTAVEYYSGWKPHLCKPKITQFHIQIMVYKGFENPKLRLKGERERETRSRFREREP
ncbi:hypothetical protein G4B88_011489 [Cannabis sativa]|uniref:Uncharacterized protein n=1 Tax=Cannabis sativa TaxID=3483 RepID=A0A7J6H989_CANSA|nr:hypothetical protein G4B88_011489 [Cannabis sativa]